MSEPRIKLGVSGILRHPEAHRYLLAQRSKNDPSMPGLWNSPGGGVEFGETLHEALVREFKEEVSLTVVVKPGFSFIMERIIPGERHVVMPFFQVEWVPTTTQEQPKAGDGCDEVGWFCWHEIRGMMTRNEMTPNSMHAFAEFWCYEKGVWTP